ncbi:MAG: permease [Bradyrhizobium sp.]|uniref:permease n=1 Tax=Bradyrhizobium sp. TaxID=376 RepID=UPI00272365DB|nr:permease [Bradyrhizobium sp.]MDO8397813.1 permease [Bradyrhizobium sp.]
MEFSLKLLNGGAGSVASYLAAHVLLCLLPAFFIAGAMVALIPKASITRWLGRNTPAYVSYPAAASAGSLLAVCSCTIVPLFAGIYRKGAGIGTGGRRQGAGIRRRSRVRASQSAKLASNSW